MASKPIIAENPATGERVALVNGQWTPVAPPPQVPKVDPKTFLSAQATLQDIDKLQSRANWSNTGLVGGLARNLPGSGAYDFQKDVDTIKARAAINELGTLKAASPTGASGFGALSEKELAVIQSALSNLDTGQSTPQFRRNLARAAELTAQSVPGAAQANPIDLSSGQSRTTIPRRAYYRDAEGNVRRNDNLDAGNPIIVPAKRQNVAQKAKVSSSGSGWSVISVE